MGSPINIGDVIALLKLGKDVIKAIQDTGGSSENYQRTIRQFERRLIALRTITDGDSLKGNSAYANAIRGQNRAVELDLKEILDDVQSSFGSSLDPSSSTPRGRVRRKFDEIKYGLNDAKKVEQRWNSNTSDMETSRLLFEMNTNSMLATLETQIAQILDFASKQSHCRDDMQSLSTLFNDKFNLVEDQIKSARSETILNTSSLTTLQQDSRTAIAISQQQVESLSYITGTIESLKVMLNSIDQSLNAASQNQIARVVDLDVKVPGVLPSIDAALNGTEPLNDEPASSDLALISSGSRQLLQGVYNLLFAFAKRIFSMFLQYVYLMPQFALFIRFLKRGPLIVNMYISDAFYLTDVLGTRHPLSFHDHRSWGKFKQALQTRFHNRPGRDRVAAGQFRILNAKSEEVILDETTYAENLEPGMYLVMSIEIVKLRRQVQRGSCLRQSCLGTLRSNRSGILSCSSCNLRCYEEDVSRRTSKVTPVYGPLDFRAEVEKMRAFLKKMSESSAQKRNQTYIVKKKPAVDEITDQLIRDQLAQYKSISQERAMRRTTEGKMIEDHKVSDLRRYIEAAKEEEERMEMEKEEQELRLFIRVHIRATIYKTSRPDEQHDDIVTDVEYLRNQKTRSLSDIVIEESDPAVATVLMVAAINEGATVDSVDPLFGTALQAAATIGCAIKATFLLQHGADPLKETPACRSAIHAASMNDHGEVLDILLQSCFKTINYKFANPDELEKALLFRDTCDAALRAATLRGSNAAILSLLNYTDRVHVGTAIWSGNETTREIIMGEALVSGKITESNGVRMLKNGRASAEDLRFEPDEEGFMHHSDLMLEW